MTLDTDNIVRIGLYRAAVEEQGLPSARELSKSLGLHLSLVEESLARLADSHVIVLSSTGRVKMAMPFSGVPTGIRVTRGDKAWWGNCAWDALGIPAAIDGGTTEWTIRTACGDCGKLTPLSVRGGEAKSDDDRVNVVIHFAVPAADWWKDIGFT